MIDFEHIGKYKENNRIEAKKSLGGLPKSIWETYSAFANTFGGIILLGVIELTDKTFKTVNLPNPERLIEEFFPIIKDKEKVSVNILSKRDVTIHEIVGNRIISIIVPRAERRKKPVYIGTNPYTGTYRRDGEGDYHCAEEEINMLLRDREERTMDMMLLTDCTPEVFDYETIRRYRTYLENCDAEKFWNRYSDNEVMLQIGACGQAENGMVYVTAAGLLMFGFEDEIVKRFPYFCLDYMVLSEDETIEERIISSSGKWSGNLFDFYLRISGKIIRMLTVDIHKPIREAVANCMINGDYSGRCGLVIMKRKEEILITNPGNLRIDIEQAIGGGNSDPRNAVIAKIFNLVKIGTQSGNGVPHIYKVWSEKGWERPKIEERLHPDCITLRLPFYEREEFQDEAELKSEKQRYKTKVIDYVTRYITIRVSDTVKLLEISESQSKIILEEMVCDGILMISGNEPLYHLKI